MKITKLSLIFFFLISINLVHCNKKLTKKRKALLTKIANLTLNKSLINKQIKLLGKSVAKVFQSDNPEMINQLLSGVPSSQGRQQMLKDFANLQNKMGDRAKEEIVQNLNLYKIMREITIKIYHKHYTSKELHTIYKFYSSPVGIKSVRIAQTIQKESVSLSQKRIRSRVDEIKMKLEDEFQDEIMNLILTSP